ncbi:MAG: hypothetical protein FWF73_07840 [Spirochaetes bacterium]|nr:hypothetical protein [Spirochaetota bacterium]
MKTLNITPFLLLLLIPMELHSGILINEISAGGSDKWVEVTVTPDIESIDISQYYVTMYYGSAEKISNKPVTLYGRNRPETSWDDRFAIIHFTPTPMESETDDAGDLNKNGIRDIYCNNYRLWNTDCVVAIDTVNSYANKSMIDFVAYSDRDGSINSYIANCMNAAIAAGQWAACTSINLQDCAVDTGPKGLNSYSTISRINLIDTNSLHDFAVTPYATPGRENIISVDKGKKRLFRTESKKITHTLGNGAIQIPLFLFETCTIKLRIFNSTGSTIYYSELQKNLDPGFFKFDINDRELKGKILTGLYPVKIEAAGKNSSSETDTVFLVIVRRGR